MAVIKLSKSGKALLFIDDSGNVFVAAKAMVEGLFKNPGSNRGFGRFALLSRLPFKVPVGKFAKSPLFNPVSGVRDSIDGDSMGRKAVRDREL